MPWIIVTYTGLSVIDGILGTGINGSVDSENKNGFKLTHNKEYAQSHWSIREQ